MDNQFTMHNALVLNTGELALQGCTVHIYDHNPLTIQTIHSIVEAHFQELRDNNLLPTHLNIKVGGCVWRIWVL